MSNMVPEKLINFRVYNETKTLLGMADAQLPSLEAMTDTVKGAGIAGEVESPVLGHFSSMSVTLNWRTVMNDLAGLAVQKSHQLELRGAQQVYDAGKGAYTVVPIKAVVKAVPKKTDLGKLEVGATQDSSWEGEVNYLKLFINNEERIELDKFNFIFKVNGVDYLADVKTALGQG